MPTRFRRVSLPVLLGEGKRLQSLQNGVKRRILLRVNLVQFARDVFDTVLLNVLVNRDRKERTPSHLAAASEYFRARENRVRYRYGCFHDGNGITAVIRRQVLSRHCSLFTDSVLETPLSRENHGGAEFVAGLDGFEIPIRTAARLRAVVFHTLVRRSS